MPKVLPEIPIGTTFGKITVISHKYIIGKYGRVDVICSCGKEYTSYPCSLLSGVVTQCITCANADAVARNKANAYDTTRNKLKSIWV